MDSRISPLFAARGHRIELSMAARLCMIAEDILQETPGRSAHVDDIAAQAIAKNMNLGLTQEEFKQKVNNALAAESKRKGALFSKVNYKKAGRTVAKRGWYRIKSVPSSRTVAALPPVQTNSIYFGKFGEYAVISELLYWGFNASPMIVDQGIDVVAEKDNKYFYLQVKAACENDGAWKFAIKRTSFDANHSSMMYYIFVLRSATETRNTYVVVPSTHIDTLLKSRSIKGDSSALSIRITRDAKAKSWRFNNTDCSMFVNAFNQLL